MQSWRIREATVVDIEAFRGLLESAGLPTDGLEDQFETSFLVAIEGEAMLGGAGVEVYGDNGLLRSVVVSDAARGRGLGSDLVEAAVQLAIQKRLKSLFLLTETVPGFFAHRGFQRIERAAVPAAVRGSLEFSHVCPDTAVPMVLGLKRP